MVDSNLQREHIKPSEKAFAYKMKLEAMKQQGKRNDLTFSPLDKKLDEGILSQVESKLKRQISRQVLQEIDNPTLELNKVEGIYDEEGLWRIRNADSPIVTHANEVHLL